jgi:hypothetical protein
MPINVTCPKCHKRFKVSEKFAGQKGPCPNCKNPITIPKVEDQVVIHAPEEFGPKDSRGQSVLKPIFREETKFSPVLAVSVGAAVVLVLIVAVILRSQYQGSPPAALLILGALLLAPPLAAGCYSFLRDQELAAFRGKDLWARAAICGAIYALLWGAFYLLCWYLEFDDPLSMADDMPFLVISVGGMLAAGGAAGHFTFDLDYLNGVLHYGFYLAVTVLLKLIMGMNAF